jgi:arsenical pump membrane protein
MMDAVKIAVVGAALLLLGGGAMALGILPAGQALGIADRVWPIMLFVVAVTVVAELAAGAGLFDVVASRLARLARGRRPVLWAAVLALATVATAFLSLDTTAVLLTPVVVAVARANGLPPLPFALATVWLANTASLLLPVSNLTSLLAVHRLDGADALSFLRLMGPSALVAVAATVTLLTLLFRREVRGRYVVAPTPTIADPVLLRGAGVVVLVLLPLLVIGLDPWMPASVAAAAMVALVAWRSPRMLSVRLVPWPLLVFASGLFLAVGALEAAGSASVIGVVAGEGEGLVELWRLAGAGMLAANAVDNLPAYLMLEQAADSPARMAAVLVGVNAGPLVTPWASLATLLWHARLHAVGVEVPWRRYVLWGSAAAPIIVAAAVVPLALR